MYFRVFCQVEEDIVCCLLYLYSWCSVTICALCRIYVVTLCVYVICELGMIWSCSLVSK